MISSNFNIKADHGQVVVKTNEHTILITKDEKVYIDGVLLK